MRKIVMIFEFDTDVDDEELDYTVRDLAKRIPAQGSPIGQWDEAET